MATGSIPNPELIRESSSSQGADLGASVWSALTMLGSLRITVWGFFFAILILLVGTLAQDEDDRRRQTRLLQFLGGESPAGRFFLPVTIFPLDTRDEGVVSYFPLNEAKRLPFAIPFPGGATIGFNPASEPDRSQTNPFSSQCKRDQVWRRGFVLRYRSSNHDVVIVGSHAKMDCRVNLRSPTTRFGNWFAGLFGFLL